MNLDEYAKTGYGRYGGLAEVIANILAAALAQESSLRPQQIQHRAKSVPSLTKKLEKVGAVATMDIEAHVKDLAGARLVFYSNSDVDRFQKSRILTDNFEIDWDRTKFHHPTSDVPAAADLFQSKNYVVRLKADRAMLPEYMHFAGLVCEVQVQTTLNHAWAETAHDTIYKKPALVGFGGRLMEGIEARMKAIMQNYLVPAGYEFQKVLSDFERLSEGKELFENDMIAAIESAETNEVLHDTISKIESHLPNLDNPELVAKDLLGAVVKSTQRANKRRGQPDEDQLLAGAMGKDSRAVNVAAASLVSKLSLQDLQAAFSAIYQLRVSAPSKAEAAPWIEVAEKISRPNLHVWEQVGPLVQETLLDAIGGMPHQERSAAPDIILSIIENALTLELEAATAHANSVQLERGAPRFSADLSRVRTKAIDLLDEFEKEARTESERQRLLQAYAEAMRFPYLDGHLDPQVATMVLRDSARIIERLSQFCLSWSFETRQAFEHSLLWQFRHFGTGPTGSDPESEIELARHAMVAAIGDARALLEKDQQYFIYKILVGYNSVFSESWEDHTWKFEKEEQFRQERIDEFVADVNASNQHEWRLLIERCAATQSDDLATFLTFSTFLERLAQQRPSIVLSYLRDIDESTELRHFLKPICSGLSATPAWPMVLELLSAWVHQGRYLSDIIFMAGRVRSLEIDLFRCAALEAVRADDLHAVFNVIQSVAIRERLGLDDDLRDIFLAAVRFMADRKDARWINAWFAPNGRSRLIDQLEPDQATAVLDALVRAPHIETHAEYLLANIAHAHPEAVLAYFEARLRYQADNDIGLSYGAVPFGLPTLAPILAPHVELVVAAGFRWFCERSELFSYRGGRVIANIYPRFDALLQGELRNMTSRGTDGARFVVEVTRAYSGQPNLHPILRDVVATEPGEEVLSAVQIALYPAGVTHGEFGRFEKLKVAREALESWLQDDRAPVRAFAARQLRTFELDLAAERERAETDIAMRRLEYGDPPK